MKLELLPCGTMFFHYTEHFQPEVLRLKPQYDLAWPRLSSRGSINASVRPPEATPLGTQSRVQMSVTENLVASTSLLQSRSDLTSRITILHGTALVTARETFITTYTA